MAGAYNITTVAAKRFYKKDRNNLSLGLKNNEKEQTDRKRKKNLNFQSLDNFYEHLARIKVYQNMGLQKIIFIYACCSTRATKSPMEGGDKSRMVVLIPGPNQYLGNSPSTC